MNPHVAKLFIYPIKSLDPVPVDRVTILKSGALMGDRRWAIFDESGNFVNGKRCQQIHALRSHFDLENLTVTLRVQNRENTATFHLETDRKPLENWLTNYFGFPVRVRENPELGFPDDTISPGPTIVSTATLEAIASWFPELDLEQVRRRFRANIELGGVPAFWEDRLFGSQTVEFKIGDVCFTGVNPCQRCVVITRDPETGEAYPDFQKLFVSKRQETLPEWVERSQFNHFFRLAVNTRISSLEAEKTISLGDITLLHH
jgi:uncharacterized protein